MEPILIVGVILFTGFVFGEVCTRIKLPKVTGYILAGILLNPSVASMIDPSFVENTSLVTNVALSFITFSVGGTLYFPKIRNLGKSILFITLFEAEFAFLFVAAAFTLLGPVLLSNTHMSLSSFFIPLALLMASLASPTDPSATLAIEHQYHAKGEVTSTVMGVAAFDDILGMINYSIAVALSGVLLLHQPFGSDAIIKPIISIAGAIILGGVFGLLLNRLTKVIRKETEGVLITVIISLLALCFGLARLAGFDELLSTMTMGVMVVNFNMKRDKIFKILERYTEELIFVLFFTLSAMHLDFSVLISNWLFILLFVVFRSVGKFSGAFAGGKISGASPSVQKYTAGGLIPQGGIVIGLALMIRQNPAFGSISDILMNVIIGATVIHEILGPVLAKLSLARAGELQEE